MLTTLANGRSGAGGKTARMRLVLMCLFSAVALLGERAAVADPASLKSNVVIVRPQYHQATRRAFADWSVKLDRLASDVAASDPSKAQAAAALRGLSQYYAMQASSPGHGTGWFWMGPDGTAYVITNKHVAGQAGSVVLEFDNDRHPRITSGEIIYVDAIHDVAVIEVPRRHVPPVARGFQLATTAHTEGNPVWAAGFPGTDTRNGRIAAYSLTDGIVSNADFPGPEGQAIAHTATIDPGISGGPLLVEEPTTELGYRVSGMNTWKLNTRTNVNLAIPAGTLRMVLVSALQSRDIAHDRTRLAEALHTTATRLADELGSTRPDLQVLQSMISYSFVAERPNIIGLPLQLFITGKLSEAEFNQFLESPVEYSRKVLWELFLETFSTGASSVGAVRLQRITDLDRIDSGETVRSVFDIAGKPQEIVWAWEHGAWRIADASFEHAITPDTSTAGSTAQEQAGQQQQEQQTIESVTGIVFVERKRGRSFSLRLGLGSGSASAVNGFASEFDSQDSRSVDVELGLPLSQNFWITLGAGYNPLGAHYPVTVGETSIQIDEEVTYLQVPLGCRVELPISRRSMTARLFGRGAAAVEVMIQKGGTFDNGTSTGSLTDPEISWYDEHNVVNVAALVGGGVEIGFGSAPTFYIGLDWTWQTHLFNEWTDQQFTGGTNYHYNALRFAVTLKYQGLR